MKKVLVLGSTGAMGQYLFILSKPHPSNYAQAPGKGSAPRDRRTYSLLLPSVSSQSDLPFYPGVRGRCEWGDLPGSLQIRRFRRHKPASPKQTNQDAM